METTNRVKRQPTDWEKTFANDIIDKGFLSKVRKQLIQRNNKKASNPIKKRTDGLSRLCPEKTLRWPTGT